MKAKKILGRLVELMGQVGLEPFSDVFLLASYFRSLPLTVDVLLAVCSCLGLIGNLG